MSLVRAHPNGFLVYFFPLCSLLVFFFVGRTGSVQLFTYIQCPLSLLVFIITMINFIHCGFRSRSRRLIENVRTQFKIKIEVSSCSLYLSSSNGFFRTIFGSLHCSVSFFIGFTYHSVSFICIVLYLFCCFMIAVS